MCTSIYYRLVNRCTHIHTDMHVRSVYLCGVCVLCAWFTLTRSQPTAAVVHK